MKGKQRENATESELKVMDEIESLIEKQPEVQKTLNQLKQLDEEYEISKSSTFNRDNYTQRKNRISA